MSLLSAKQRAQSASTNLSFKLLQTLGGPSDPSTKKSLTNINTLSNRLKMANKQYEQQKQQIKAKTQEWIRDQGIDLGAIREQARQTTLQERKIVKQREMRVVREEENLIEPSLQDLGFQEFGQQIEEKIAYRAIFESLNKPAPINQRAYKPKNHIKSLIKSNINRLCSYEESPKTSMVSKTSQKTSDSQNLRSYQNSIAEALQKASVADLHQIFLNAFQPEETPSKTWIPLIHQQIVMAQQIYDEFKQGELGTDPRNYLAAVSIEALEKIYTELYKKNRGELLSKYKLDQTLRQHYNENWRELYFMLRKGERNEFLRQCLKEDKQLAQLYENLFERIDSFQHPDQPFTQLSATPQSPLFETIIKSVVLQTPQKLFSSTEPSLHALEQPWFILLTLGFAYQHASREETQRSKRFKEAVMDYFKSVSRKIVNSREDEEDAMMYLVVGLLSLGSIRHLFMFYDKMGERFTGSAIYVDMAHLFFILASHPSLIYCQHPQSQANQILRRCLLQVISFLQYLKRKNLPSQFRSYFTLFLSTLNAISRTHPNFEFETLIDSICGQLILNYDDLQLISHNDLAKNLKENSQVVMMFQQELIKNIIPKKEKEFMGMAQFCSSIQQNELREQIFIKLIIFNYFESDKELRTIESGVFGGKGVQSRGITSATVRQVEDILNSEMDQDRKFMLHFLRDLKELRHLVVNRRTDMLRKYQQRFAKHKFHFESIFNYLTEMDPGHRSGLLDIYNYYFERLYQMYRLIYLGSSNLQQFHRQRQAMIQDLTILVDRYPALNGQANGRVFELLTR